MLNTEQTLIIISMLALGTMITRFLPFLLFPGRDSTPQYIVYLGQMLPYAAIGLLVIFCLKGVSLVSAPYGLPEGLAILGVILLHLWKGNTLLSIGVGTLLYMLLVQTVFA